MNGDDLGRTAALYVSVMSLRQKEGLSANRMGQQKDLLDALGNPTITNAMSIFRNIFEDVSKLEHVRKEMEVLRITMNLDGTHTKKGLLTDRQQFCADEIYFADLSTVKKREKKAVQELVAAIEQYQYSAGRRPDSVRFEIEIADHVIHSVLMRPFHGTEDGVVQFGQAEKATYVKQTFLWVCEPDGPSEVSFQWTRLDQQYPSTLQLSIFDSLLDFNLGKNNWANGFTGGFLSAQSTARFADLPPCKPGNTYFIEWSGPWRDKGKLRY